MRTFECRGPECRTHVISGKFLVKMLVHLGRYEKNVMNITELGGRRPLVCRLAIRNLGPELVGCPFDGEALDFVPQADSV